MGSRSEHIIDEVGIYGNGIKGKNTYQRGGNGVTTWNFSSICHGGGCVGGGGNRNAFGGGVVLIPNTLHCTHTCKISAF